MDDRLAQTPSFSETNIALISDVVRNFRSAVMYRTDVGLLHARFLLSVVTRMKEGRKREAPADGSNLVAPMAPMQMTLRPAAAPVVTDTSSHHTNPTSMAMMMQPQPGTTNESPTLSLPTVPDPAFAEFDMNLFGNNDLSSMLMPPSDAAGVWSDNPLAFFPFDMDAMMSAFPNDGANGGGVSNLFG